MNERCWLQQYKHSCKISIPIYGSEIKRWKIPWLAFYQAFTWTFIHKNKQLLAGKKSSILAQAIANIFLVNAIRIANYCYCCYKTLSKRLLIRFEQLLRLWLDILLIKQLLNVLLVNASFYVYGLWSGLDNHADGVRSLNLELFCKRHIIFS